MKKDNKKLQQTCSIKIDVIDNPGVLLRIVLIFSRKAINIDSLNVTPVHQNRSIIIIETKCNEEEITHIIKKLDKLIDVTEVSYK